MQAGKQTHGTRNVADPHLTTSSLAVQQAKWLMLSIEYYGVGFSEKPHVLHVPTLLYVLCAAQNIAAPVSLIGRSVVPASMYARKPPTSILMFLVPFERTSCDHGQPHH